MVELIKMKKPQLYEMAKKHKMKNKIKPEKGLSSMNKAQLINFINLSPNKKNKKTQLKKNIIKSEKSQIEKIYEAKTLKELDKIYDSILIYSKRTKKNLKRSQKNLTDRQKNMEKHKILEVENKIKGLKNNKKLLREGNINSVDLVKKLNTTNKVILLYAGLSKGGKNKIYGQNSSEFKQGGVPQNFINKKKLFDQLPAYLSLEGIKIIKKMDKVYKTLPSYKNYNYDNHFTFSESKNIKSCSGFYLKKAYDALKEMSKYKSQLFNIKEILKIKKITEQNVRHLVLSDTHYASDLSDILDIGKKMIKNPAKYNSKECLKHLQKKLDNSEFYNGVLGINNKDEIIITSKDKKFKEKRRR